MGKFESILTFSVWLSLVGGAGAETISKPHNFTSETTIRSSQVNENFDVLYNKINNLQNQVDILKNFHSIPTEGLIAYYPFNGNANDESGKANHGTVHGAILLEDRFGNANSAYNFDGVDDYIIILSNPDVDLGETFTISVWIKRDSITNVDQFIVNRFSGGGWGLLIEPEDRGGKIQWSIHGKQNLFFYDVSINDILSWHHILLIKDSSGKLKFKLDGGSDSIHNVVAVNGSGIDLYVGKRAEEFTTSFFPGSIDDIRIYNRALSESEIQELYNAEKP